jgi:hypothetical protein
MARAATRVLWAMVMMAVVACDDPGEPDEPVDGGSAGDGGGDAEAGHDGGASGWACLDDAPREAPAELAVELQVVDFVTKAAPEGLQAVVCLRTDIDCRRPVAGPYGAAAGALSFTITGVPPGGFDGYVRLTADDLLPLELQFGAPLRRDVMHGAAAPLLIFSPLLFENPLAILDTEVDLDAAGVLMLRLRDCAGEPAAGLRATAEPADGEKFFGADAAWSTMLDAAATDASGQGGLLHLAPAMQTVTVSEVASGRRLFDFAVEVSPRTMVFVDLDPAAL